MADNPKDILLNPHLEIRPDDLETNELRNVFLGAGLSWEQADANLGKMWTTANVPDLTGGTSKRRGSEKKKERMLDGLKRRSWKRRRDATQKRRLDTKAQAPFFEDTKTTTAGRQVSWPEPT